MWKTANSQLEKEFKFENFSMAVYFVNLIKDIANNANHHPDLLIHSYNHVKVMLKTHDKDAITEKDHNLASEIDEIFKNLN